MRGFLAASALVALAACGGGGDDPAPVPPDPTPTPTPPEPAPLGDPLRAAAWHWQNTGQTAFAARGGRVGVDMNVADLNAAGVRGQGVAVLVVDSGLDIRHEDLAANVDASMLHNYDPDLPSRTDPTPPGNESHGTEVAGIIGAVQDNGLGSLGLAPEVRLGAVRYLCEACQETINTVEVFGNADYSRNAWVINGSFGSEPLEPESADLDSHAALVAISGLSRLRDGKGILFVKAAGNAFEELGEEGTEGICAAANAVGLSCHTPVSEPDNIPATVIVTAAVNADGRKSSYSSAGANVLVSGLGGEYGNLEPAIVTTDLSGCEAGGSRRGKARYANDFENPDSMVGAQFNPHCNYTSAMNGTSAATPTVSAVVALMLSANPELTWRDVRDILVQTSRRGILQAPPRVTLPLDDGEYVAEPGWVANGAGHAFSTWYGYGLVDAQAAVDAARARSGHASALGRYVDSRWVLDEDQTSQPVPPGRIGGAAQRIAFTQGLTVESVALTVSLSGEAPLGDVAIELVSPSGTRSVLLTPFSQFLGSPADSAEDGMLLASQAFYGEPAQGTWTLRVIDVNARDAHESGVALEGWALRVFGH